MDAEDRNCVLEKKAAKKQKKLEFSAKLAEAHKTKRAIKAAGTVTMEDVIRAVGSKSKRIKSKSSTKPSFNVDLSSILGGLGIQSKVEDFSWKCKWKCKNLG